MADEADLANDHAERELQQLLLARRKGAKGPEATGACLWCGEGVERDRRWCDADCRTGWERDELARRRAGSDRI